MDRASEGREGRERREWEMKGNGKEGGKGGEGRKGGGEERMEMKGNRNSILSFFPSFRPSF
jgi:hypothetical protein